MLPSQRTSARGTRLWSCSDTIPSALVGTAALLVLLVVAGLRGGYESAGFDGAPHKGDGQFAALGTDGLARLVQDVAHRVLAVVLEHGNEGGGGGDGQGRVSDSRHGAADRHDWRGTDELVRLEAEADVIRRCTLQTDRQGFMGVACLTGLDGTGRVGMRISAVSLCRPAPRPWAADGPDIQERLVRWSSTWW